MKRDYEKMDQRRFSQSLITSNCQLRPENQWHPCDDENQVSLEKKRNNRIQWANQILKNHRRHNPRNLVNKTAKRSEEGTGKRSP